MLIAIAIAEEIQDYKGLGGFASFELLSFLRLWQEVSQLSDKFLAKVEDN